MRAARIHIYPRIYSPCSSHPHRPKDLPRAISNRIRRRCGRNEETRQPACTMNTRICRRISIITRSIARPIVMARCHIAVRIIIRCGEVDQAGCPQLAEPVETIAIMNIMRRPIIWVCMQAVQVFTRIQCAIHVPHKRPTYPSTHGQIPHRTTTKVGRAPIRLRPCQNPNSDQRPQSAATNSYPNTTVIPRDITVTMKDQCPLYV